MGNGQGEFEDRVQNLEHAAGYADRHIEVLSGEVAELSKSVMALTRRLAHLESRLSDLNDRVGQQDPGNVPPPHSAGPDIPREPL